MNNNLEIYQIEIRFPRAEHRHIDKLFAHSGCSAHNKDLSKAAKEPLIMITLFLNERHIVWRRAYRSPCVSYSTIKLSLTQETKGRRKDRLLFPNIFISQQK